MSVIYKSTPLGNSLIKIYRGKFGESGSVQRFELFVLMYLGTEEQEEHVQRYIERLYKEIESKCREVYIEHNRFLSFHYREFSLMRTKTNTFIAEFDTLEEAFQYCEENNLILEYKE